MDWHNDSITVSTNPSNMDRQAIFEFLHYRAYWSKGIPYDICMKSLDNSVPFSVHDTNKNFVGFARLVTDHATFAYLGDVFILEEYRGKGYSKFLVRCINQWIDDHRLRTSLLLTSDAQGLYSAYGWVHPSDVTRVMRYKDPHPAFYNQNE